MPQKSKPLSPVFRYVFSFCLFLAYVFNAYAQSYDLKTEFASELVNHLGLSQHGHKLEQGSIIHSGLLNEGELPEEIVAVGAMLLIKGVEADRVIEEFMHTELFQKIHSIRRYELLNKGQQMDLDFGRISESSSLNQSKTVANPIRYYNLSYPEGTGFKEIYTTKMDRVSRAELFWGNLFEERLGSFIGSGIDGISAYARLKERDISPAQELAFALKESSFFTKKFPIFIEYLKHPEEVEVLGIDQRFFWLEAVFDKQPVWALSSELRMFENQSALAVDMHFYVSRGYNSMITFVGVVPYGDHSLVYAINHTYTDAVLGFLSTVKKREGRRRIAESLSAHLAQVRMLFE